MSTEERIERTFDVGEEPRLFLSNVSGYVTVAGEERDDIQITAVKHTQGCRYPERTEIAMRQDGDQVIVKTRDREKDDVLALLGKVKLCRVDYTVAVPTNCSVRVRQVAGAVQITGVDQGASVNAVDGVVKLHQVAGRTDVRTVSAGVEGSGWTGRAEIDTVSGPVRVEEADLSDLSSTTVSGDMLLNLSLHQGGHYRLKSVSGDISVRLPEEQGLVSRGSSLSGRFRCALPCQVRRKGFGRWRAVVNGGGPAVRFSSISGDLSLEAAAH
jgi:DUF4097 and DUF4098 domain-containing protein YvlB